MHSHTDTDTDTRAQHQHKMGQRESGSGKGTLAFLSWTSSTLRRPWSLKAFISIDSRLLSSPNR
eukprot:1229051-Rhodomonas_salina.3